MKAFNYIFMKQYMWARNNGIQLIGSKGTRGRRAYTPKYEENLFQPLRSSVKKDFEDADGGELIGSPPKMGAIHSSSALGVNIFHYWLSNKQVPKIAAACGFCSKNDKSSINIRFEQKFPISKNFRFSPNIDVVIENKDDAQYKAFAVECKFSEAYTSRGHSGLKKKYIELGEVWDNLPNLYKFAKLICPKDKKFLHLHPAQLVKHILGLNRMYGKDKFCLMYLWYDCLGEEGARHQEEIDRFGEVAKRDGVKFHAMSYQELISRFPKELGRSHEKYLKYISSRYL